MREYELVIILDPKAKEKKFIEFKQKIEKLLAETKIKIAKFEDWGVKELAYPISKNRQAHYLFYLLQAEADAIRLLENKIRVEEIILRHLIIRN